MNTNAEIWRRPKCRQVDGLSDSTRDRLERAGKYPARIQLSTRMIGWLASDVLAWVEARHAEALAKREAKAA